MGIETYWSEGQDVEIQISLVVKMKYLMEFSEAQKREVLFDEDLQNLEDLFMMACAHLPPNARDSAANIASKIKICVYDMDPVQLIGAVIRHVRVMRGGFMFTGGEKDRISTVLQLLKARKQLLRGAGGFRFSNLDVADAVQCRVEGLAGDVAPVYEKVTLDFSLFEFSGSF